MGACWAHNPEVDGSKPSSASFFFCFIFIFSSHHLEVYALFSVQYDPSLHVSCLKVKTDIALIVNIITSQFNTKCILFVICTIHILVEYL